MNETNSNETVKITDPTLSVIAKSRESTQKNALDASALTSQVMTMSGSTSHEKLIGEVFTDETISIAEKIDLIRRENDAFDDRVRKNTDRAIKLQKAQTKNIRKADAWIAVSITAGVAGFIYFLRTPEGQKAFSSITSSCAKLLAA